MKHTYQPMKGAQRSNRNNDPMKQRSMTMSAPSIKDTERPTESNNPNEGGVKMLTMPRF